MAVLDRLSIVNVQMLGNAAPDVFGNLPQGRTVLPILGFEARQFQADPFGIHRINPLGTGMWIFCTVYLHHCRF